MTSIVPTIGRIVLYTMPNWQAEQINRRRKDAMARQNYHEHKKLGAQLHIGNSVVEGQVFPAMVVAVWGNTPDCAVNLKVLLDGSDDYWVTSVSVEEEKRDGDGKLVHTPGKYHWMEYQKGQAAKTEALEKEAARGKASQVIEAVEKPGGY